MNQQEGKNKKLEIQVSTIIRELGISESLQGFQYLKDAILFCIANHNWTHLKMNEVSSKIVENYSSITPCQINCAMRYAIEHCYCCKEGNIKLQNEIFRYSISLKKGRPTFSEFIAAIANYVILENENDQLKKKVSAILGNLGVPANIYGYYYLQSAILITIKDPNIIFNMKKILYPTIAKEYSQNFLSVERPMRYAIKVSFERGNLKLKHKIFGCSVLQKNENISISEFISAIVDYLNLENENNEQKQKISDILRSLGVSSNINGYYYLRSAILNTIKDPEYSITDLNVARCIRHAIKTSCERGNVELQHKIFGYHISAENGIPKTNEFISAIIDNLNLD